MTIGLCHVMRDIKSFILALTTMPPHMDLYVILMLCMVSYAMQPSASSAGTNRMTYGGHHCLLNVCNRGSWVTPCNYSSIRVLCGLCRTPRFFISLLRAFVFPLLPSTVERIKMLSILIHTIVLVASFAHEINLKEQFICVSLQSNTE